MSNNAISVRWGKYDAHANQLKSVDRIHIEFPDDEALMKQIFGEQMRVTIEAYPDRVIVMRKDDSRVRINRRVDKGGKRAFFVLDREGTAGQCHNLHRLPPFALADAREAIVREDSILVWLPSAENICPPKKMTRGKRPEKRRVEARQGPLPLPVITADAPSPPLSKPKNDSAAARLAVLRTTLNHAIRELRELGLSVQVTQAQAGGDVDMLIKF